MRIIIFTTSSNRSGGTRQAIYQARGLADMGHDVSLCLPHDSSFWELPHEPHWVALPESRSQWKGFIEGLFGEGPAIVHAFHNRAVKLAAWWGLFWRFRGVTCVAHRGVIYRPKNPLPYVSPAIRAFLVNSRACARAISLYTPKKKIHIVRNAVPDERTTPCRPADEVRESLGLTPGMQCFVYIGNNTPVKGAEVLLRAFAKASLPHVRLVMIGTEPQRWAALNLELGLRESAIHLGHVEHVSDYLQIADAFVFPTNLDSAPNTLLEAIRMGLPVIATNVGGVPEIVKDNGMLVPPGDISVLSEALHTMAFSPDKRAAWAQKSMELGASYTLEARCSALESIYEKLLPGSNARS